MNALRIIFGMTLICAWFSGCASNRDKVLDSGVSQVEIRSYQSRVFDTNDKEQTLRNVIATLQDLGFVINDASALPGTVSGNKFDQHREINITISVRTRGETQSLVRASLEFNSRPVYDPEPYQQFFNALGKAMFLSGHETE